MANISLNRLVELLARATGFYEAGTATGTHSTTTLQDTSTTTFNHIDDNILKGKWLTITDTTDDAAPEGESRKVSSVSTTTLTVDNAFTVEPADNDTYELTPFMRQYYVDAIQEATRQVYPDLYVELRDETLVVDNLLTNWDFETAGDGTPVIADWIEVGGGTVTQDTTRVKHGTYSAKVVADGGADQLIEQNLFDSIETDEVVGLTVIVRGHSWASDADAARLQITFDGSTYHSGPMHGGSHEWEGPTQQYIQVAFPADATEATVTARTLNGFTAYWDSFSTYIKPISQYTLPTTFVTAPHRVSVQRDLNYPSGHYEPLVGAPQPGHILRMEGRGRLSVPTTTEGTTEVGESEAELIVAMAARRLFDRMSRIDQTKGGAYKLESNNWAKEVNRLRRTPGIRMPRKASFIVEQGDYRIEADGSNRYINLPRL
jgi:hypothetical protein